MQRIGQEDWLRHSLLPAGRLIVIYVLGFGTFFWLVLRPPVRLISDSLWRAVVPESVTAGILASQSASYARIPIRGSAVVELGDGFYTLFVQSDTASPVPVGNPNDVDDYMHLNRPSGARTWASEWGRSGLSQGFETNGRTATPLFDFRVEAGEYRIESVSLPALVSDSTAELLIGSKLTVVASSVLWSTLRWIALATIILLLSRRALVWHRDSDKRLEQRERQDQKARFWREFMRETLPHGDSEPDE